MSRYYWGVDLGGTKIECAVMSYDGDRCVLRERIATQSEQGYEHVLQRIKLLVELCAEKVGEYPESIGFGTPGALDPQTGVMKNCNSTSLNGQPLHNTKAGFCQGKAIGIISQLGRYSQ